MKRFQHLLLAAVCGFLAASLAAQGPGKGFGKGHGKGKGAGKGHGQMPEEMREVIHGLFNGHDKIQREVKVTKTGYRSTTTSKDPQIAAFLQTHVQQMKGRLDSGMMVRRWDPAYEEFVKHYDDIDIEITNIEGGISIVATGKNDDARKVVRNHAAIIDKFVQHGWSEHDRTHAAVLSGKQVAQPVAEVKVGEIKKIHQAGDIYIASQPTPADLEKAKASGVKTVFNIRHDKELDFEEAAAVKKLGIQYVHLPWDGEEELTDSIFDKTRAILQTAERPILFHCGSANRAAGAWLAWRALDQDVEIEQAVADAKAAGLRNEAYEAKARAYVEKRKTAPELSSEQEAKCLELGEKASTALMKNLGGQLKAALSTGDALAAVSVCKTAAQPITHATNEELQGVTVSRTSLKTRNADQNRPDATDRHVLKLWDHKMEHSEKAEPTVIPIHENAVRYYRPILVQETCLKCHGPADSIAENLRDFLKKSYPNDQAIGYEIGDLRGAFRVDIDLEKALE